MNMVVLGRESTFVAEVSELIGVLSSSQQSLLSQEVLWTRPAARIYFCVA